MRRKDRCGPGITNCDETGGVPSSEESTAALGCCERAAAGSSPLLAKESQFKRESATRTDRQREDFTAGFLAELARPQFTLNLSRKAGVSSTREPKCPDLGGESRTLLRIRCRQKYLILSNYPSCFLGFLLRRVFPAELPFPDRDGPASRMPSSFCETQAHGMRKHLSRDFGTLSLLDLGGNRPQKPKAIGNDTQRLWNPDRGLYRTPSENRRGTRSKNFLRKNRRILDATTKVRFS